MPYANSIANGHDNAWRGRRTLAWVLGLLLLGYGVLGNLRPSSSPPVPASATVQDDLNTLRKKSEQQLASTGGEKAPVQVIFRTGQSIVGELVAETAEQVTIEISGVQRTFAQAQIDRVVRLASLSTRYRQWRADIPDGDVGQIEQLIYWLLEEELYHVANYEAALLESQRPRDPRIAKLARQVAGQTLLFEQRGLGVPREVPPEERPIPLLNAEQINLIRVYEIDLLDPPRIRIDPRDIQEFLLAYRSDPRVPQTPEGRQSMIAGPPLAVLRLMFELRAREFYGKVRVLDDPATMRHFRRDVAQWIHMGCATSDCHGGPNAGGLRLENRNPRGEAGAYTNFLILTRFNLADGTPLIDYENPNESPLLHLGLRRQGSRFPHPEVPREPDGQDLWREAFIRPEDTRWRATTAWIRSLYQPRPDYPVVYPPEPKAQDPDPQGVPEPDQGKPEATPGDQPQTPAGPR